jgi:hypothetical protein
VQGYAIKQPLVRWGESEALWSKDVNLFYILEIERLDAIGWKRVASPSDRERLRLPGKFALSAHLSAL